MTTRPNQLQAAISGAFDAVLSPRSQPGTTARQAQHRADFEHAWERLGYPADPALKRRTFAALAPRFTRWDARRDLTVALARDDHRRRMETASALGRAQGRALARREHGAAILAALDRRITADRERRARLRPAGPIRLF